MSTKDRTREKLLSSMRKTKAAASDTTQTPAAPAPEAPARTSARASAAEPERTAKQPARPASAPAIRSTPAQHDPYQSRGRIWPD